MTDKKPIRPDGIYTPVVPPYVPPRQKIERGTANTINRAEPREKLLNVAGYGEVVPVLYGEDRVGGVFIAGPVVQSNFYICAIAWSATNEHGIEGVQQVVINGSTAAISGATITHYKGTQDTIDATLTAAFAGFNQKYAGIAYTVFKIPAAGVNGVPRIEAVARGMKIKDPRTDAVSWTENPALHMFDFVTNDKYGAGMTVRGLTECADYCDSIYKTLPRCRAAIYINEAHDLSVQLDMFAAYAECLWSYEGSGVFIVPDAVVAPESITDISISSITIGTMRLGGVDASNVPTRVTVTHTTPSAVYSDPWPQNSVYYDAAGVTTGDLDVINSDVRLIGIHRELEARRKCLLRLKRLSVPARISFQMQGDGIAIQRGDVKRLPDMLGLGPDYLVRIMSNELVSYGEYQMTAEPYSKAMYDVDVDSGSGVTIPVGGIIAFYGSELPAGFSAFTDAGENLLYGSGSLLDTGSRINTDEITVSGTVSVGNHTHANLSYSGITVGSAPTGFYQNFESGAHSHSYNVTTKVDKSPRRFGVTLIKAVSALNVPIGGAVFARSPINSSAFALSTKNGLLLSGGSNAEILGSGSLFACSSTVVSQSFSSVPDHAHGGFGGSEPSPFSPAPIYAASGAHSHTVQSSVFEPRIDYIKMAQYVASVTSSVPDRAVIGFSGESIPSGWDLCADLEDRFIQLTSSIADINQKISANTGHSLKIETDLNMHSHELVGIGEYFSSSKSGTGGHLHQHSIESALPTGFKPSHYKMVFIEYIGE